MKWPWQTSPQPGGRLVFGTGPQGLAWMLADDRGPRLQVTRCGCLPLPDDKALPAALKTLGIAAGEATALLDLDGYQLLQIDAPSVPPDELRAAARWRIRDLIDTHVDEVTIDVMRVGQPRPGGNQPLFVVAARSEQVQALSALAHQADWPLSVIDVADTTQRNLQAAAAAQLDLAERACACLMRRDQWCLLTICVGEELYYSRRLDWDPRLVSLARQTASVTASDADRSDPAWTLELDGLRGADDSPRLLTELQRSFDVWERSWPDLPLSLLLVAADDDGLSLSEYLQEQLGLRVLPLNFSAGLDAQVLLDSPPEVRRACAPLLGALLRDPMA